MSSPRSFVVGVAVSVVTLLATSARALGVEVEGGAGVSGFASPGPLVHGEVGVGLLFGERDQLELHLRGTYPPWTAPFLAATLRGRLRFGPTETGPWLNLALGGGPGVGISGPSVALLAEVSPALEFRAAPHLHLLVGATLAGGTVFFPWGQDVARSSWSYTWSAGAFVGVAFGSHLSE